MRKRRRNESSQPAGGRVVEGCERERERRPTGHDPRAETLLALSQALVLRGGDGREGDERKEEATRSQKLGRSDPPGLLSRLQKPAAAAGAYV